MRCSNWRCYGRASQRVPLSRRWEAETSPNNPGNFHWQAWDYADELVARMRGEEA